MLKITHSSIDTFRTCHKKYYWEYDQLLKPRQKSWPLLDGEAFDAGLNWLYGGITEKTVHEATGGGNGSSVGCNRRIWPIIEGCKTIIDNIYDKGGRNEEETYIHKETIKGMLQGYVLAYPPDEFDAYEPQPKGEVLINNTYMREGKFILKFKADALVGKVAKAYLFETKTTSANSIEQFLDNLRLDDQPDTYLYGFRRLGHPVLGVIYNVIRKPKHRKGKSESPEGFVQRVQDALRNDSELPVEERKYYFRETIYRSPEELSRFEEETKQVASDMEAYMAYRSPSRCGFMFGEKCPFLPLCEGGDSRDKFLDKSSMHGEYKE